VFVQRQQQQAGGRAGPYKEVVVVGSVRHVLKCFINKDLRAKLFARGLQPCAPGWYWCPTSPEFVVDGTAFPTNPARFGMRDQI
jgi:hypothetical protein